MATFSKKTTYVAYGTTSTWHEETTSLMRIMPGRTWVNRLTFSTLSSGYSITALTLNLYRNFVGDATFNFRLYASNSAAITPAQVEASASSFGTFICQGATGMKAFTLSAAAMSVISNYTGTWYLYIASPATGNQGGFLATLGHSNTASMSGEYIATIGSVNIGGVMKGMLGSVNIGGVMKSVTGWVNIGGVWKKTF